MSYLGEDEYDALIDRLWKLHCELDVVNDNWALLRESSRHYIVGKAAGELEMVYRELEVDDQ